MDVQAGLAVIVNGDVTERAQDLIAAPPESLRYALLAGSNQPTTAFRERARTHGPASHRTRSAARLDRSAQPPGALKSGPRQSGSRPLFSLSALISRGGTATLPVREKRSRRVGSWPARPILGSRPGSHSRRTPGLCASSMEGTGETDSVAEGRGFKPPVPPKRFETF
jgi:hypothetical protein